MSLLQCKGHTSTSRELGWLRLVCDGHQIGWNIERRESRRMAEALSESGVLCLSWLVRHLRRTGRKGELFYLATRLFNRLPVSNHALAHVSLKYQLGASSTHQCREALPRPCLGPLSCSPHPSCSPLFTSILGLHSPLLRKCRWKKIFGSWVGRGAGSIAQ